MLGPGGGLLSSLSVCCFNRDSSGARQVLPSEEVPFSAGSRLSLSSPEVLGCSPDSLLSCAVIAVHQGLPACAGLPEHKTQVCVSVLCVIAWPDKLCRFSAEHRLRMRLLSGWLGVAGGSCVGRLPAYRPSPIGRLAAASGRSSQQPSGCCRGTSCRVHSSAVQTKESTDTTSGQDQQPQQPAAARRC